MWNQKKSFNGSFSNYQNEIEAILREYQFFLTIILCNEDGVCERNVYFSPKTETLSELPLNFKK
jgi:hypothetical protein